MSDGPDWRQVDRARLLQARAEERKKMTEEWLSWLEDEIREGMLVFASGPDLLDRFEAKVTELRARLSPPPIPLPEPKPTPLPETETTPLAETKPSR